MPGKFYQNILNQTYYSSWRIFFFEVDQERKRRHVGIERASDVSLSRVHSVAMQLDSVNRVPSPTNIKFNGPKERVSSFWLSSRTPMSNKTPAFFFFTCYFIVKQYVSGPKAPSNRRGRNNNINRTRGDFFFLPPTLNFISFFFLSLFIYFFFSSQLRNIGLLLLLLLFLSFWRENFFFFEYFYYEIEFIFIWYDIIINLLVFLCGGARTLERPNDFISRWIVFGLGGQMREKT